MLLAVWLLGPVCSIPIVTLGLHGYYNIPDKYHIHVPVGDILIQIIHTPLRPVSVGMEMVVWVMNLMGFPAGFSGYELDVGPSKATYSVVLENRFVGVSWSFRRMLLCMRPCFRALVC